MALKDERQMIPADNVDVKGTQWATVGENIRHGAIRTVRQPDIKLKITGGIAK